MIELLIVSAFAVISCIALILYICYKMIKMLTKAINTKEIPDDQDYKL